MTGKREPSRGLRTDGLFGLNEHLRGAIRSGLVAPYGGNLDTGSSIVRREQALWRDGVAGMQVVYRTGLPDNWQSIDSSLLEIIDAVEDSGISLVWAPRDELVLRLVAAASRADREDLLANEREAVLADLGAAIEAVGVVELEGFDAAAAFARDALAAAIDGHLTAAQSLAACGLEPAVKLSFGIENLGEVRKQFDKRDVEEVTLTLMKVTLLQMCTVKALAQYRSGEPLPVGFNRHATLHGERACFSDANALSGMLLLIGWLREFRWFADHHPRMFRAPA
jgi:hypothetical protein